MSNTIYDDAVVETYDDVKGMLFSVCIKYASKQHPVEELMSEAHEVFMLCYQESWDPSKPCSFSSWLYQKLRWRMLDAVRLNSRMSYDSAGLATQTIEDRQPCIDFYESIKNDDARYIIWYLLNTRDARIEQIYASKGSKKSDQPIKIQNHIRRRLLAKGWSKPRIDSAYKYISKFVKGGFHG